MKRKRQSSQEGDKEIKILRARCETSKTQTFDIGDEEEKGEAEPKQSTMPRTEKDKDDKGNKKEEKKEAQ